LNELLDGIDVARKTDAISRLQAKALLPHKRRAFPYKYLEPSGPDPNFSFLALKAVSVLNQVSAWGWRWVLSKEVSNLD
jgi:hypothetical protein